ncbi:hypothetical protein F3Y22_tig00111582pilonHSYRG00274 [Hibiscus syriacus]|uniref:Reverse transcriptase zinc-binding domain-containing protein n=1 Tax=Hibiscus syriacus TaxID=106335 RepID=A0A6A2YIS2_HIBSY|nr:hypothetical protein F3Y22_tig00111582pilonHSYRG00274 [Hibiscus syriacus]
MGFPRSKENTFGIFGSQTPFGVLRFGGGFIAITGACLGSDPTAVMLRRLGLDDTNPKLGLGFPNRDLLQQLLTPEAVHTIRNIHTPALNPGTDRCIWDDGKQGLFTVKSAYTQLSIHNWSPKNNCWSLIWKLHAPESVRCFIWLAIQDKLLPNVDRWKRNLTPDPCCEICGLSDETSLHILRDCTASRPIWDAIIHNNLPGISNSDLFHTALSWANHYNSPLISRISTSRSPPELIKWSPTPNGWVTLNTDAAVNPRSSNSSMGVRMIAQIFPRNWTLEFKLIKRESNLVADHLAKAAISTDGLTRRFPEAPPTLHNLLDRGIHGPPYLRPNDL